MLVLDDQELRLQFLLVPFEAVDQVALDVVLPLERGDFLEAPEVARPQGFYLARYRRDLLSFFSEAGQLSFELFDLGVLSGLLEHIDLLKFAVVILDHLGQLLFQFLQQINLAGELKAGRLTSFLLLTSNWPLFDFVSFESAYCSIYS